MSEKLRPATTKGKFSARHIVTSLGILLLTFGVFAWQLSAFKHRTSEALAETTPVSEPPKNTHWDEANTQVRMAVAEKVRGHLDALRRKNYAGAMHYHTTAVRQSFPTEADFQREIKVNYPQLPGNKKVVFRFVNTDKKFQFANAGITVTAPDGTLFDTVYQLSFEGQEWGVSGISRLHRMPLAAPQTNSETKSKPKSRT